MTDSAIASDIHKTLDVQLDGGTELTLDSVLAADDLTDCSNLLIVPVAALYTIIDAALVKNLLGRAATDTEDIGQTYLSSFVVRSIYTGYSCHNYTLLDLFY